MNDNLTLARRAILSGIESANTHNAPRDMRIRLIRCLHALTLENADEMLQAISREIEPTGQ